MKTSRLIPVFVVALLLVFSMATGICAADYTYVQNDADMPTKFSIDKPIADGFTTNDLYVGTTKAYLGDKADGATPIFKDGLAIHPADILITNGKVGIVLAVGTADPWGYPGGSILDAGRVTMPEGSKDFSKATFGTDTVLTCQFLFNRWDEWAPVNCGMVYFDLVKYDFDAKKLDDQKGVWAVQVSRKYTVPNAGIQRDFDIVSYYSIAPGADYAYMYDTVTNKGNARIDAAITNDISLSNKGGDGIDTKTIVDLRAANTYNWVADEKGDPQRAFSTTLIVPGENESNNGTLHPFDRFRGAVGYREFTFKDPGFDPAESRVYQSYLMIDDECSWQKVYDFYADYNDLKTFTVSGKVKTADGAAAKYPVVIVERDGNFYGWVMGDKDGNYKVSLPDEGAAHSYVLKVEMTDMVTSDPCAAFTAADDGKTIDLNAGAKKVPVVFKFSDADTNKPVYGRVEVGATPTVAFTGKSYFMTDNSETGKLEEGGYGPGTKEVVKGEVTALVAPGDYEATCYGEGYKFSSYIDGAAPSEDSLKVTGNTATDTVQKLKVKKVNPTPDKWYGIDNHHHGIRMDAFAAPEVVAKAQVTAGLEVLTLDDHEFVLDNWPVYQWGKKMGITGYMPSEEVTASWAHFDIMPLSVECYEQHLDREQKNVVVNTNQSFAGMMDQGHFFGASIGANHPTYSYGLLLADTNKTVPGGLNDEFDGLEAQASSSYTNEAMAYWTAFAQKGSHRNVAVERPHYIWGSTDIHTSGTSANSGNSRSYVFLENGEELSATDFDRFGLEFARSQAIGHSFVSTGVYITPATADLMYGETYWADKNGDFTAKFDISSLTDITNIYVFSSLAGEGDVVAGGALKNYKYLLTDTDVAADNVTSVKNYRVNLMDVEGKQWFAIAAVDSRGRMAMTNPIWINGPDVKTETITDVSFQTEPTLPKSLTVGKAIEAPASAGILITEPWSVRLVEDWTLKDAEFGTTVKVGETYTFQLTYTAPKGYVFDQALGKKTGFSVSEDGTTLVYSKKYTLFEDVTDAEKYYYDPVYWAVNHEPQITKGTTETTFSPAKTCTRKEVVTFLWRAKGEPEPKADNPFTDIKTSDYFYKAVLWAVENNITTGTSKTTFSPNKDCTRGEVVTFLHRAEGKPAPTGTASFSDVKDDAFYRDAVLWAVEKDITKGTGDNKFSPNKTCTRGEIVTFLYRALRLQPASDKDRLPVPAVAPSP